MGPRASRPPTRSAGVIPRSEWSCSRSTPTASYASALLEHGTDGLAYLLKERCATSRAASRAPRGLCRPDRPGHPDRRRPGHPQAQAGTPVASTRSPTPGARRDAGDGARPVQRRHRPRPLSSRTPRSRSTSARYSPSSDTPSSRRPTVEWRPSWHTSAPRSQARRVRRPRGSPGGRRPRRRPRGPPSRVTASMRVHHLVDAEQLVVDQLGLADAATSASRSPPARAPGRRAAGPCRGPAPRR